MLIFLHFALLLCLLCLTVFKIELIEIVGKKAPAPKKKAPKIAEADKAEL